MKFVPLILAIPCIFAQDFNSEDIKNAIHRQDMYQVKSVIKTDIIPYVEKLQIQALEQIKNTMSDFIDFNKILEDKIDTFELYRKLEEMDLGVIQAELEFLAEENFLTNAVNYAFVHFAEIKEFITQNGWSLGENNLENVEIVRLDIFAI